MTISPALELLVQGYLTLDWPADYSDSWGAVDDFLDCEPIAVQLPGEIDLVLGTVPSDEELSALLVVTLGSGYLPDADGFTWRGWLVEVRERARRALGT